MRRLILILGIFALLPALAAGQDAAPVGGAQVPNEYKIGPKDLLDIRFYGQEKLNALVRVSEQGKVTLTWLNEVDVNGLTAAQLEKRLVALYKVGNFLVDPQISVFIKEMRSNRVSIVGAIQKPAAYEILGRQTLLGLIAEAGGLTKEAAKEINVLRTIADGTTIPLTVSINELMNQGDPKANIALEPGDIVNVQVDKLVPIYVFGQVKNPGALSVWRSNIPALTQAIAQAGGFTDRAKKSSVIVRRRDASGNEKIIRVNVKDILAGKPDFQLQEGDTVYVEETWI
jgi:polysaccharide export outer membrane protein